MLGLELDGQMAVAVALDESGRVVARAEHSAAGDAVARGALDALGRVAVLAQRPLVGVAAMAPESDGVQGALRALAETGARISGGAIASGTACAAAEAWIGAARGLADVVYLAMSDHASAGIISGGFSQLGAHNRAASAGWMALNPVEREDYRRAGCLEVEAAARGIVRRLMWRIKSGDSSSVQGRVGHDLSAITIGHVLDAARAGDGLAISVIRDTARFVGMAAANLVVIVDPEALVLGGLLASASDLLFDQVRAEITRRAPESFARVLNVVPAALGADAAAIGAARLAAAAPV